jgi:hypothetical protein
VQQVAQVVVVAQLVEELAAEQLVKDLLAVQDHPMQVVVVVVLAVQRQAPTVETVD